MNIEIKEVQELPKTISELAKHSAKEGFSFVHRLIDEFESGVNRFDGAGEFFLLVYDGEKLIACGGLNQQRTEDASQSRIGRVSRFYVLPKYRQQGVGKLLLQFLEKKAIKDFSALCLQTHTKSASNFYQKMNYVYIENYSNYNYFKYLI